MSTMTTYADTPLGRLGFTPDAEAGAVCVQTKEYTLGWWYLDRFGGELTKSGMIPAAGIRQWVAYVTEAQP